MFSIEQEENDKKDNKPARKSKARLSLAERAAKESQEILKVSNND